MRCVEAYSTEGAVAEPDLVALSVVENLDGLNR
jgi:hypothetical protein